MALKKRADGRYVRAIKDERTGKRVYFYGASEREINKKILDYTARAERGRLFSEVADEWWGETLEKIAYNTVSNYKTAYHRALEEFGDSSISEIKPKDIGVYLRKLSIQGYSQKTVKNHKIVVSRIFQTAVMDGDIDFNPAAQAEIPRGLPQSKRLPTSEDEAQIILDSKDLWLFPFAALMTGLRKGELLALQWKDIDFENNVINVTKSVYHQNNAPKIKKPKTDAGVRPVILLSALRDKLLDIKGSPDEYIFSEDGGKTPYTKGEYERAMKAYKAATGITTTAQPIRKRFATTAAASKMDAKVLQKVMGHTDITTTLGIYASVDSEAWQEARDLLEQKTYKNNQKST